MAQAITCDTHPDRKALVLIHEVEAGNVEGYCPECWPQFCLAFAHALGWAPGPDLTEPAELPPGDSADVPHVGALAVDPTDPVTGDETDEDQAADVIPAGALVHAIGADGSEGDPRPKAVRPARAPRGKRAGA